jgi:hypothetical protein
MTVFHAPLTAWLWVAVFAIATYLVCRRWPASALLFLPLSVLLTLVRILLQSPPRSLAPALPGGDNLAFHITALVFQLSSALLGLNDGGFRFTSYPPWGTSRSRSRPPSADTPSESSDHDPSAGPLSH